MSLVSPRISVLEAQPDWSKVSKLHKGIYESFLEETHSSRVVQFSYGKSLTNLVDCAEHIFSILPLVNPFMSSDQTLTRFVAFKCIKWRQIQTNFLKLRVLRALNYKIDYYTVCTCGRTIKAVLVFFKKWNDGNTPAVEYARNWVTSV